MKKMLQVIFSKFFLNRQEHRLENIHARHSWRVTGFNFRGNKRVALKALKADHVQRYCSVKEMQKSMSVVNFTLLNDFFQIVIALY